MATGAATGTGQAVHVAAGAAATPAGKAGALVTPVLATRLQPASAAMAPGAVGAELIPFEDGTVLVAFEVTVPQTVWNAPGGRARGCELAHIEVSTRAGTFRRIGLDWLVEAQAWVPARGASTAELVTVDDSWYDFQLTDSVRC